jgi:hypothetical protein
MDDTPKFQRPAFDEAMKAWKALLKQRGYPDYCLWLFAENICFEPDPARPGTARVLFQTLFTPKAPTDAEAMTYDYFCDFDTRMVFYRLGSSRGRSVCLVLCDDWFESRGEAEGYLRRDEWRISFRPGPDEEVEEITDEKRWKNRMVQGRPLHEVDFCMPLRHVHETVAHGRVLSTYERYAVRFFHLWWRMLGRPERR